MTGSVQLVATVLVWENCWYFMPSAAGEDPILRVSCSVVDLGSPACSQPAKSLCCRYI